MDPIIISAEDLFSRALKLPPGAQRDEFIAAHCLEKSELHSEVDSLLRAHDKAGDFLHPEKANGGIDSLQHASFPVPSGAPGPQPPVTSAATLNAANYAEYFLRDCKAE